MKKVKLEQMIGYSIYPMGPVHLLERGTIVYVIGVEGRSTIFKRHRFGLKRYRTCSDILSMRGE